jgi:hypothetical protein
MSVEIEWVETVKGGEKRREDSVCGITTTRRALVACPPSATVADLRALCRLALGLGGEVLICFVATLLLHCCYTVATLLLQCCYSVVTLVIGDLP